MATVFQDHQAPGHHSSNGYPSPSPHINNCEPFPQPKAYIFDQNLTARDFEETERSPDFVSQASGSNFALVSNISQPMSDADSPSEGLSELEFPSLNNLPPDFSCNYSGPTGANSFEGEDHGGLSGHSIDTLGNNFSIPLVNSVESIRQPAIAFEPTYILAYGPFDAMDRNEPNDPSLQPIDYCIYLYPSTQMEPREHFVYGGSRFHPAQMESYIRILPPPSYIAQLDPASIQLLEESIQLLRQGVPPHMKIRIPWSIMAGLTHIQTSPYGYAVHQSPQIEALIQIAAVYAYNSTSAYAQLVRHLHPGIESFGYHYTTHDICPCCEDHEDTDHDETDELINDSMVDEESDSESESEEDYMESSLENASHGSLIE